MGSGFWRRFGEKNSEGSGRTVDCAGGKRKGVVGGGDNMAGDSGSVKDVAMRSGIGGEEGL